MEVRGQEEVKGGVELPRATMLESDTTVADHEI